MAVSRTQLSRNGTEEWIVAGSAHEEEHRKGKPEGRPRSEIVPAHQAFGLGGHGGALLGRRARPNKQARLRPPEYSPGIWRHHATSSATHAEEQGRIWNLRPAPHAE